MSYYNRHKRSRSNQRLRVDVNDSDDEEANLPDVILEGYLHKTVSRLGSRVRRFYVLSRTAAALLYFNTPEERFPSGWCFFFSRAESSGRRARFARFLGFLLFCVWYHCVARELNFSNLEQYLDLLVFPSLQTRSNLPLSFPTFPPVKNFALAHTTPT